MNTCLPVTVVAPLGAAPEALLAWSCATSAGPNSSITTTAPAAIHVTTAKALSTRSSTLSEARKAVVVDEPQGAQLPQHDQEGERECSGQRERPPRQGFRAHDRDLRREGAVERATEHRMDE